MNSQDSGANSPAKTRTTYEVAAEVAGYAPDGGDAWQNVGVRAVPVRQLTELKEALARERRVHTYHGDWGSPPYRPKNIVTNQAERIGVAKCVFCDGFYENVKTHELACASQMAPAYAGAWRFDG